jgi:hypothetical protein
MSINLNNSSRLITFGDSWTAGHGVELDIHCKEVISPNPFIDKLRTSNGWPRHLANLFDIPFVNFGWCNYSNKDIINSIKENIEYFDKNDIIIVMLSFPYRDGCIPGENVNEITNILNGFNYFLFNSFAKTFSNELEEDLSKIDLSKFLGKDFTMVELLTKYEIDNDVSVWEYNFRYPHSWQGTLYGDTHPNYLGYKVIANKMYELINEYDNNTNSSSN